jgi:hypothetical protein
MPLGYGETLIGGIPLWSSTSGGTSVNVGLVEGQIVHVFGVTSGGGQDWYRIQVPLRLTTGEWIFGWLPASIDGSPTLAPSAVNPDVFSACPAEPRGAGWFVASNDPAGRALCASGTNITLDGYVGSVAHAEAPIFSGEPDWLADEPTLVMWSVVGPAAEGMQLGLHIDPASRVTYSPEILSDRDGDEANRVHVTGHFNDAAADDCRRSPTPETFMPMTDEEQALWCRQQFVVDQIHVGDFRAPDLADLDTCENAQDGYRVGFPDAWYTNTAYEGVAACRFFNPGSFVVTPGHDAAGAAISIRRVSGPLGWFDAIIGSDEASVAGVRARRYEVHGALGEGGTLPRWSRTYVYALQLSPDQTGPHLVLGTDNGSLGDHETNRAVLDAMVQTLQLLPAP